MQNIDMIILYILSFIFYKSYKKIIFLTYINCEFENVSETCCLYTSIFVFKNAIVKSIAKVKPPYGNKSIEKKPTTNKNTNLNIQLLKRLTKKFKNLVPVL